MQKFVMRSVNKTVQFTTVGRPTIPEGRQPFIERKINDPSSAPTGGRYPIPSFLTHRTRSFQNKI